MIRPVDRIEPAMIRTEGDQFDVRRALPLPAVANANPFLLMEEIEPVVPAAAVETPQRPARGFEEVTWVLAGSVDHVRREHGADAVTAIGANRAEWLTSGRGDVYLERFAAGAQVRTLRIWIALPRKERRVERRVVVDAPVTDSLQMWSAAGAYSGTVDVDVLAGRLLGARATITPQTRVTVARLRLPPDVTFIHAVDSIEVGNQAATVVLYVLEGQALIGPAPGRLVHPHELVTFTPPSGVGPARVNSDEIRIQTRPGEQFDGLWLSGLPIARDDQPFVQHGSIVMRTEDEILQALEDYRAGRLGTLT